MEQIKIDLGLKSYNVHIGSGLLKTFNFVALKASTYIIITDTSVNKLYGKALKKRLAAENVKVELLEIPSGEKAKSLKIAEDIGRKLAQKKIDKDALIIALGGGVVGDLSGFIASVYKRGVTHIHVPTTLLAQVDSCIGGKTGINLPEGKNLFGTIYQPQTVIIDIKTLKSLPQIEIRNGIAEVIKYGVIADEKLFNYLEKNIEATNEKFLSEIIRKSITIKSHIIEKDEEEKELRKILNYGHTVGHAIEIHSQYSIPHGEAIAIGMAYEGKIAASLGLWGQNELKRQNNLIIKSGFPITYKKNANKLIEIIKRDKKVKGGNIFLVLLKRIGKVGEKNGLATLPVNENVVKKCLL